MMGYDDDDEYTEEVHGQQMRQLVHDPAMVALTAMPLDGPNGQMMADLTPEQVQYKKIRQQQIEALGQYEMQAQE